MQLGERVFHVGELREQLLLLGRQGAGELRFLAIEGAQLADEGIINIESIEVLKVKPLTDFGSPIEIIKEFGSKEKYFEAIKELESELYKTA